MSPPRIPEDDAARVRRLRALELMDTPPEPSLDVFTRLAADVAGHPIAMVCLIDQDRQWVKSAFGTLAAVQSSRDQSFCGHAILSSGVFEVADARIDPRFRDNPSVTGGLEVVHYAGVPLCMPDGEQVGTLCVVDHQPRTLYPHQRRLLAGLAAGVVQTLLVREQALLAQREAEQRASLEHDLRRAQMRLELALEATALGLWEYDVPTGVVRLFDTWGPLFSYPRGARELPVRALGDLVPGYACALWERELQALVAGRSDRLFVEHEMVDGSGRTAWVASEARVCERDGQGQVRRILGSSRNVTENRGPHGRPGAALPQARRQAQAT